MFSVNVKNKDVFNECENNINYMYSHFSAVQNLFCEGTTENNSYECQHVNKRRTKCTSWLKHMLKQKTFAKELPEE